MKILGFNPSHHGSVCLLEDGELKFFIEEERIGKRTKHAPYPFKSFIDILQNTQIDNITWGSPSQEYPLKSDLDLSYWAGIADSYSNKQIYYTDYSPKSHHLCHVAQSFYNSGFKEAIGVVIDGLGSSFLTKDNELAQETETIFRCSYPSNFKVLFKNLHKGEGDKINLAQCYETITTYLGWGHHESGKTMGLASYGKFNPDFPEFFIDGKGNPDLFLKDHNRNLTYPTQIGLFLNEEKNPKLSLKIHPKKWHHDKSKISHLEKDIAWRIQNDTQHIVGDLIEKYIKKTGLTQVCCSGGYFLNCVTNYYLLKRFPNIEFYFEPISSDAGTAIGSAKLLHYSNNQDTTIRPLKSLYLGKQYSKEELLKGIKKYIN